MVQEAGTRGLSVAGSPCSHFKKVVRLGQSFAIPDNYANILQVKAAHYILIAERRKSKGDVLINSATTTKTLRISIPSSSIVKDCLKHKSSK